MKVEEQFNRMSFEYYKFISKSNVDFDKYIVFYRETALTFHQFSV